jgi:hypothetical protein
MRVQVLLRSQHLWVVVSRVVGVCQMPGGRWELQDGDLSDTDIDRWLDSLFTAGRPQEMNGWMLCRGCMKQGLVFGVHFHVYMAQRSIEESTGCLGLLPACEWLPRMREHGGGSNL